MDLLGHDERKSCIVADTDCGEDYLGCHRVSLLGVDEVGEEYGVPEEEDDCLVLSRNLLT